MGKESHKGERKKGERNEGGRQGWTGKRRDVFGVMKERRRKK